MLKKLLWIALLLTATTQAAAPSAEATRPSFLRPEQQQMQSASLAAEVLTRFHYKPMPLDDAMSEKVFNLYLKSLDPDKFFQDLILGDRIDGRCRFIRDQKCRF